MNHLASHFLENAISRSLYYKSLAEKSFEQLSEEEIHLFNNFEDNNTSIIAKHIAGNLLSRWTDFGNSDGEKPWRNRDSEFVDNFSDKASLLAYWEKGWTCFISELQKLNPEELLNYVFIRNEKHTVVEAIQRQLNHNSYHVGQIVYIAKSIRGQNWKSLSIPKNKSEGFNRKMGL